MIKQIKPMLWDLGEWNPTAPTRRDWMMTIRQRIGAGQQWHEVRSGTFYSYGPANHIKSVHVWHRDGSFVHPFDGYLILWCSNDPTDLIANYGKHNIKLLPRRIYAFHNHYYLHKTPARSFAYRVFARAYRKGAIS